MRRSPEQRRADRAAGVDRHGRPLPRAAGTNPRALQDQAPVDGPGAPPSARTQRHQPRARAGDAPPDAGTPARSSRRYYWDAETRTVKRR